MTSVVTLLDVRSSLIKKRCILEMHRDELVECTPDTHTEVGKFAVSQMGLANNGDTIKVGEDRFCFQDNEGFVLGVNTFSLPETWQLCPDVSVREDIRSVTGSSPSRSRTVGHSILLFVFGVILVFGGTVCIQE